MSGDYMPKCEGCGNPAGQEVGGTSSEQDGYCCFPCFLEAAEAGVLTDGDGDKVEPWSSELAESIARKREMWESRALMPSADELARWMAGGGQ